MLHVRDCPGTTSTYDICPYPWCRKTKHLLYHLVSCPNPDQCKICTPQHLTPQLRQLRGLNSFRRKNKQNRKPPSIPIVNKVTPVAAMMKNNRNQLSNIHTNQTAKRSHGQHLGPLTKKAAAITTKKDLLVPSPIPTIVQSAQQNQSVVTLLTKRKKVTVTTTSKPNPSIMSHVGSNHLQVNLKPHMKTANPILQSPENSAIKVKNLPKARPPPPANPLLKKVNVSTKSTKVLHVSNSSITPSTHTKTVEVGISQQVQKVAAQTIVKTQQLPKTQQAQHVSSYTHVKQKVVNLPTGVKNASFAVATASKNQVKVAPLGNPVVSQTGSQAKQVLKKQNLLNQVVPKQSTQPTSVPPKGSVQKSLVGIKESTVPTPAPPKSFTNVNKVPVKLSIQTNQVQGKSAVKATPSLVAKPNAPISQVSKMLQANPAPVKSTTQVVRQGKTGLQTKIIASVSNGQVVKQVQSTNGIRANHIQLKSTSQVHQVQINSGVQVKTEIPSSNTPCNQVASTSTTPNQSSIPDKLNSSKVAEGEQISTNNVDGRNSRSNQLEAKKMERTKSENVLEVGC